MTREELLASSAMGFVFGLFAFAAVLLRVRYWTSRKQRTAQPLDPVSRDARYESQPVTPSEGRGLWASFEGLLAFDRFMDLLAVLLVIGMLLYGAWIAPRLRLVLAVGVATALGCSFLWAKVAKWLPRRKG